MKTYISIAGNIGCGKSSLTTVLSQRFRWKAYYEPVETNPYLRDFYSDMPKWSFHTQIYFLTKRFRHIQEILQSADHVVQDRSIYEDAEVFARSLFVAGLMPERDYMTYLDHFNTLTSFLRSPNLLIYLRCSPDRLFSRIQKRGRDYETEITSAYLERLDQEYESWFEAYDRGPKAVIDVNRLDFVNRQEDLQQLLSLIRWEMERANKSHQISLPWAMPPASKLSGRNNPLYFGSV